jgi:hypothetical protein
MKLTGEKNRDLGFIQWSDSLASLENMNSKAWDSIIQNEKAIFDSYKNKIDPQLLQSHMNLLSICQQETRPAIFTAGNNITISPAGSFSISWKWNNKVESYTSRDRGGQNSCFDPSLSIGIHTKQTPVCPGVSRDLIVSDKDNSTIFVVNDSGNGSETFKLSAVTQERVLWSRSPVGPTIGLIGNKLYYLGAYNHLRYNKLYSCSIDGTNEELLFEENDAKCNLFLQRAYDGSLFLIVDNSGKQKTAMIGPRGGLHWIHSSSSIFPIGCCTTSPNIIYNKNGQYISSAQWKLPYEGDARQYSIEWGASSKKHNEGWLTIKQYGERHVYWCSSKHEPQLKYKVQTGSIYYDTNNYITSDLLYIKLLILTPNKSVKELKLSRNDGSYIIHNLATPSFNLIPNIHIHSITANSADGTAVHGRIISAIEKPKALLVIGYGAYGLQTSIHTCKSQWAPLLKNGWAISYAFVRGGGDHTEEWVEGGRHLNRLRSIEDFEAIIQSAQHYTGCSEQNTVIYGRSAGGLLVGATLNRGVAKIAGVFTEVPYVDVLRTSSNPTLPLTEMEYEEFGDPRKFVDFMLLASISPIDNIIPNAASNKFVLCRSGLNDKEVLPYEPVKWILTLRKMNPALQMPKILAMEVDEGHFYSLERGIETRAIDLLIIEKNLFSKIM